MLLVLVYVGSGPVATCERRSAAAPVARAHARRETRDAPNALKDTRTRESRWKIPLVPENRAEGESGAQVESGARGSRGENPVLDARFHRRNREKYSER